MTVDRSHDSKCDVTLVAHHRLRQCEAHINNYMWWMGDF